MPVNKPNPSFSANENSVPNQPTNYAAPNVNNNRPVQPQSNNYANNVPQQNSAPQANKVMSPWAYFGYGLLFCIPLVGLILNIVFCFDSSDMNRRNYARSYWCWIIISIIISIVIGIIAAIAGFSIASLF